MRFGLSTRLFIAILVTAVLSVLLVGGAARFNFERGFLGYLNDLATERMGFVHARLSRAYGQHSNWDFLRDNPHEWFGLIRPVPGDELPAGEDWKPGDSPSPTSDLTGAMLRLGLLDAQGQWVTGYRDVTAPMPRKAIVHQGQTVGWIVLAPFQSVADGGDQRFQRGQAQAAIATSLLAVAMAALAAWWVSRRLVAPVRRVAAATHLLAAGHHEVRVDIDSPDEVGQLSRDFNHLARTLAHNASLRRDFMADVSHELRTPLAVLRGELEALEDGIRPLTPQAIGSLLAEVRQIGDLVNDLHELSLSDVGALRYRLEAMDLGSVIKQATDTHRARIAAQGLTLTLQMPAEYMPVQGDHQRLLQLMDNLLENSRRYTDAPGTLAVTVQREGNNWAVQVDDSAPGVPAGLQGQLFDRFFRVDRSRNRDTGGSGLGLAMCRNIVLAHSGEILASESPLGGVRIAFTLPVLDLPSST